MLLLHNNLFVILKRWKYCCMMLVLKSSSIRLLDRTAHIYQLHKHISSYINRIKQEKYFQVVHDAKGCSRDCWSFCEARNQLVVGNSEVPSHY